MSDRTVVLVCGNATLDRLECGLVPGGPVFYAAHTLAALGADVRVLTRAGPDLPVGIFRFAEPEPRAGRGPGPGQDQDQDDDQDQEERQLSVGTLSALVLPSPATTVFENVYGPDGRRTQRVLSVAPALDPARVPAAWHEPDLLLLAPVLGELDPAAFVRTVRARRVGLCAQGLVRAVRADGSVVPRRWEPDVRALAGVAAAVLGEDEATGQPDLVEQLAAAVPIVAFTHGAAGCEVLVQGRGTRRVGTHPAPEVDPTGAGDVFAAAFLLALARGSDPVDAARLGAAAASIVVEGRGGETLARVPEAWGRAAGVPVA
jgi:1D-myo-inositol 3-kinase